MSYAVTLNSVKQALEAKGHKSKQNAEGSLQLSCLFHSDNKPSAFVLIQPDKRFYKCFSCGKKIDLDTFIELLQMESLVVTPEDFDEEFIDTSWMAFEQRKLKEDQGTFPEGEAVFKEAMDYRMFPNCVKYLESRLGKNFELPPNFSVRFHEERHSLLFKGVEDVIVERFSKKAKIRFKNYGSGLFHHYKSPHSDIILCEGIFDYLKLCNAGYNSAALLTSKLTSSVKTRQLLKIMKTSRLYSFLDKDLAGSEGTIRLKSWLNNFAVDVFVVQYSKNTQNKDPGSMSYDEIWRTIDGSFADNERPFCTKTPSY